jgi:DNA-directed RNA polymerase specialized sigma24 family protein
MEVFNAKRSRSRMAKSLFTFDTSSATSATFKAMNEVLEALAIEAQQQLPQTEERQFVLVRLVDEMLRSRSICRPLGDRPLCNIQEEIYEQVRQQLLSDLDRELDRYQPERIPIRQWAYSMRAKAFRQVLNDARLKALAITIQQLPVRTELRQHLLGELIEAIRLSGKLCHPHRKKFLPTFYELLYEEAVSETLLYVCQNIDKYDPERGKEKKFITWVNFHLDKLVIDCRRKFSHLNTPYCLSLTEIEEVKPLEQPSDLSEMVREYLKEDAENLFSQAQIENRPNANFRAIALARLSGKSWGEISQELGIVVPTLSSFYQRCCRKFAPKFKKDLQS